MDRRVFGITLVSAFSLLAGSPTVAAELKIGEAPPAFTAVNSDNKPVNLSDYRGKTVVLEWTNDGCPYVRKHYNSGNMQALQKKWTGQGIVWLSVISSPPGEQGYATPVQANKLTVDRNAVPSAVLLDPKQQVARAYNAVATPTMFVITPEGKLAYMGAIDDKPSTRLSDVETAKNYLDAALTELKSGKTVSTPVTRAYGCVVKYTS